MSAANYPSFFQNMDPTGEGPYSAGKVYLTREHRIASGVKAKPLDPHQKTAILVCIDFQASFCCPDGALYVPGAEKDVYRTAKFILDNGDLIGDIYNTVDTHRTHQIFHPLFWVNVETGEHPEPFTVLTLNKEGDIVSLSGDRYKAFRPLSKMRATQYLLALERQGSAPLTIWPYHCRAGSTQQAVMPLLVETQFYHELTHPHVGGVHTVQKGFNTYSESYGVFADEVVRGDNQPTVQMCDMQLTLKEQVESGLPVIFTGEASSHCVKESVDQFLSYLDECKLSAAKKNVIVLVDCMSHVPSIVHDDPDSPLNFFKVAEKAYASWRAQGVRVTTTTELDLKKVVG